MQSPFSTDQLLDMLAGGLGGFVKGVGQQLPWKQTAVAIAVGSICALYLAPIGDELIAPLLGKLMTSKSASHLGGFVVGLLGMGLVGFIIGMLQAKNSGKRDGQ